MTFFSLMDLEKCRKQNANIKIIQMCFNWEWTSSLASKLSRLTPT